MKFFCDFGDGPKIGVSDYSLIPPGGDTNDTKSWKEGLLAKRKISQIFVDFITLV